MDQIPLTGPIFCTRRKVSVRLSIFVRLAAVACQAAAPPVLVLGRKPGTKVFRPRSKQSPEDEPFAGLLILTPAGIIVFANEQVVQKH